MKTVTKLIIASTLAICALGVIAAIYRPLFDVKSPVGLDASANVLATVNGQPIRESQIRPLQQRGMDRTVALDRIITQAVLAQAAEKSYAAEAQIALASVHNDILSQLYTSKRTMALRDEVSEKDIAAFYEKNVTAEQGRLLKVKAYITPDAKDAQLVYQQASGPKDAKETKDAIAKMQYLSKDGEHFMAIQDLPYNLGQVVKKMKAGDVLQPVVLREGILVAMLEEFKDQPRPPLEKVREDIRAFLVNEKIEKEVQSLRKGSKIELKS